MLHECHDILMKKKKSKFEIKNISRVNKTYSQGKSKFKSRGRNFVSMTKYIQTLQRLNSYRMQFKTNGSESKTPDTLIQFSLLGCTWCMLRCASRRAFASFASEWIYIIHVYYFCEFSLIYSAYFIKSNTRHVQYTV